MRLRQISVLAAALLPAVAGAQPLVQGFDVQQYDPTYAGDRFFAAPEATVDGRLQPAVKLTADYAWRALRVVDAGTNQTIGHGVLVRNQLYFHLDASLALFDRAKLDVGLPFAAFQNGETPVPSGQAVRSARLADMRLGGRVNLWHDRMDRFSLGLQADLWLPSGSKDDYAGSGGVRGKPQLVASGLFAERYQWALAVGSMIAAHHDLGIAQVGSTVTYSGALAILLMDHRLQVGPELFGSTLYSSGSTPLEAMLGAHLCFKGGLVVGAGAGAGLTHAPGAAAARALLDVAWEPGNVCGIVDRDGDGIADDNDACPDVPGIRTNDPKTNGCPDRDRDGIVDSEDACPDVPGVPDKDPKKNGCPPDRDGDGIADAVDACPDVPGVKSDDPKKNGCPPDRDGDGIIDAEDACPDVPGVRSDDPKKNGCPPDRDGDGIADADDACPDVPGVPDKDPKKNGCPPDRDNDGIADAEDACPDLPGLPNKDPKKNGCPSDRDGDGVYDFEDACPDKPGPRSEDPKKNGCPAIAVLTKDSISILQQVQFEYNKAVIRPVSDKLLGEVSGILRDHPEIEVINVEGHTDNVGKPAYNLNLSQKRAEAVRDWLVKRGKIDAKRLTAKGFGQEKPIDSNATDAGRQNNRRVEFRIPVKGGGETEKIQNKPVPVEAKEVPAPKKDAKPEKKDAPAAKKETKPAKKDTKADQKGDKGALDLSPLVK